MLVVAPRPPEIMNIDEYGRQDKVQIRRRSSMSARLREKWLRNGFRARNMPYPISHMCPVLEMKDKDCGYENAKAKGEPK